MGNCPRLRGSSRQRGDVRVKERDRHGAIEEMIPLIGVRRVRPVCAGLLLPGPLRNGCRHTGYVHQHGGDRPVGPRRAAGALSAPNVSTYFAVLNSQRSLTWRRRWYTLLDEGNLTCSESPRYTAAPVSAARPVPPPYTPNWLQEARVGVHHEFGGRISPKLRGPAKWSYYYLYVILRTSSPATCRWMVASRERRSGRAADRKTLPPSTSADQLTLTPTAARR